MMIHIRNVPPPRQTQRVGGLSQRKPSLVGAPKARLPRRPCPDNCSLVSAMLKRSSTSPSRPLPGGDSHGATNPKKRSRVTPLRPAGLPIGGFPLSLPRRLAPPPLPRSRAEAAGRGRLCARGGLWPRPRLCSRRRGGRGAGCTGGGGGRRAAGSAAGPCGAGAGGRGPQPAPRAADHDLPGRLPPCPASPISPGQRGGMRRAAQLLSALPMP
jgi:hypothetical protein